MAASSRRALALRRRRRFEVGVLILEAAVLSSGQVRRLGWRQRYCLELGVIVLEVTPLS
jgi:hypothetical protein